LGAKIVEEACLLPLINARRQISRIHITDISVSMLIRLLRRGDREEPDDNIEAIAPKITQLDLLALVVEIADVYSSERSIHQSLKFLFDYSIGAHLLGSLKLV